MTSPTITVENIDFAMLREQKRQLIQLEYGDTVTPEQYEALLGIICLIDAIQDQAVDVHGLPASEVFNLTV